MKKLSLICALCALVFSCSEESMEEPSLHSSVTAEQDVTSLDENVAMQKFAEILSKAVFENMDLRGFIKEKAIQQFDKDFDVFYPLLKDEMVRSGETFRNVLLKYTTEEELSAIERALPLLNIYVPDLSLFADVTPYNWDITDEEVPVTFLKDHTSGMQVYVNGEDAGEIPQGSIPGFHMLVVKNNERVVPVSVNTRGIANSYQFKDEAFDGTNGVEETRETRAMFDPDSIDWIPEEKVDPIVKNAYEVMKKDPSKQRDNIYYGLVNENDEGSLNMNIDEHILRLQLSPNCFTRIADQEGDPRKDKGTVSNKKSEISDEEALNRFWADGKFELRVLVSTGEKGAQNAKVETFMYTAKPQELFHVPIEKSYRHKTKFRHSKYYYTIDPNNLERKWYYPAEHGYATRVSKWDISKYSLERFVQVYEFDDDVKITKSRTETVSYTSNFKNNLSFGEVIKVGLGLDASTTHTTSTTITTETEKASDELGSITVYFYDAVMVEKDPQKGYRPKNVSSGDLTITMCPMSDSFTRLN